MKEFFPVIEWENIYIDISLTTQPYHVDKHRHLADHPPPLLVYVVIEWNGMSLPTKLGHSCFLSISRKRMVNQFLFLDFTLGMNLY